MTSLIDRLWYGKGRPLRFLTPLSWLYGSIAASRRRRAWDAKDESLPVPVLVIGNITAGGTGKSPLAGWLVTELSGSGWQPVIISRGYGGKSSDYPLLVTADTNPSLAGDEPVMLAQATGRPVVVDPDRRRGACWALEQKLGNILVCDDGLQHYKLPRDIELAVFDGVRGIGNGALIPVGPLRESVSRLSSVDYVVVNGGDPEPGGHMDNFDGIEHPRIYSMTLEPSSLINLKTGETRSPSDLHDQPVRAVAGIGNPVRFFDTLRELGARVTEAPFPDHHGFRAEDLDADEGEWVVMTAKDAVKCQRFARENVWALTVQARLPSEFSESIMSKIRECSEQLTFKYQ
ncbi:tetraacyldisaccharide 4'-kinase [Marinobacter sediminum]|uniref:tetraacyldisaccharide 4'-kinase n=1 Tax=Marinobacter sediminum TaxID=256323 RepID=UPI00202DF9D5|nr:tetraacyldisaccharide 4'-kinase [Marinobacter sediminum]MCM0611752.1 tetraacyldisaccharide 4'-kinase [Marinobacter sediminum]